MMWNPFRDLWRSRSEPAAIEEIDEELTFHLQALVRNNLDKGMSFDEAWRNAQDRFGSFRRYSDDCRRITGTEGSALVLLATLGIIAVGLLMCWIVYEVRTLRIERVRALRDENIARAVAALRERPPVEREARVNEVRSGWQDLAGSVTDPEGKPLAGADVAVILKTWPGGSYRQQAFSTQSNNEGRFHLPELIPPQGKYAIHVAALKQGYAFSSTYQLIRDGQDQPREPVVLKLHQGSPATLVVKDEQGRPVADARVVPASRESPAGAAHLVYFHSSEPLRRVADARGRVRLAWFEPGDRAEVYVQRPGHDWELHSIQVPQHGEVVVISDGPAEQSPSRG
jgi:hypothetical protein